MTSSGSGQSVSNIESGYAQLGKLVVSIDNLPMASGVERAILLRNNGPNVVYLDQIERFESELDAFDVDGLVNVDLDLIFTPNLSGTSEIALAGASVFRITDKGVAEDVNPLLFDIKELTSFSKAAVGNKKIEVATNALSFFASNQSTTVSQSDAGRSFNIPYAIGPGAELVLFITNEAKINVLDVDVDIVLSGYAKPD